MNSISKTKIFLFLLFLSFISSIVVGVLYLNKIALGTAATLYMFAPATSVALLALFHKTKFSQISFRLNLSWRYIIAIGVPLLFCIALTWIGNMMPGVHYVNGFNGLLRFGASEKDVLFLNNAYQIGNVPKIAIFSLNALIGGITINTLAALGEEIGWRGFLWSELKPLGFIRCSLTTGFIWGIWHAPLILRGYNYPHYPILGTFMMIAFCIFLSFFLGWLRESTDSIIPCALFHGVFNASAQIPFAFLVGGDELNIGVTSFISLILLAFFSLGPILSRGSVLRK